MATKYPGIKEIIKGEKYQITVNIGTNAKGKRKRDRHYFFGGIHAAVDEKKRREVEAASEGIVNPSKMTLAEYLNWWFPKHAKLRKLADKTVESYKEMIDGYLIPELGDILLTKLTAPQIEDYMIKLGEKGLTRTVDYSITILRLALKHAKKKYKLIKENPAAEVDLPPKEETEQKAFDGKQMLNVLAKAKKIGHQDYRKWVMGFYTGMRRGEIMGLQWSYIDLDGAKLEVRWTLQRLNGQGLVFKPKPKTRAGYRVIELPKTVVDIFREIQKEQASIKLFLGKKYWQGVTVNGQLVKDLVFCLPNGRPESPQAVSKRFHKFMVQQGIEDFSLHNTRHTNLSLLIADGVDDVTLASHAGHAKASTSKNMYGHAFEKKKREAMDRFEEQYGENGPKKGQKAKGQKNKA